MKTPYVPHVFGAEAKAKTQACHGWLTAGVVSSIAWPQDDVLVRYDGHDYFLQGVRQEGEFSKAPCISTPCADGNQVDEALSRLYRFVSVLGYFKRGYVDITSGGVNRASFPIGHVNPPGAPITTVTQAGNKAFSCNHMPIIEDDQVRKALAFLREGRRLRHVHEPYSFLSFFKVIESQFEAKDRVAWVDQNLGELTGRAAERIAALQAQGINVNKHLFDSGRCAVAHASLTGTIVDPDVSADRRRIAADLDVIEALATRYVEIDAGVPDEMDLYESRDRVAPWYPLMTPKAVETMKGGGQVGDIAELGKLEGATVSVRLWPDPPAAQFASMTLRVAGSAPGCVKLVAISARKTIRLAFAMDVAKGKMHTLLNETGFQSGADITEQDVEDATRYFHSVVGNGTVELTIEGAEPVDCEVVIPVNIIPRAPEEAVAEALEGFRRKKAQGGGGGE